MTAKRQSRINAQREVVHLLQDFARRLAREFGVTDASAKAQLPIINYTARDCVAAQKAGQRNLTKRDSSVTSEILSLKPATERLFVAQGHNKGEK